MAAAARKIPWRKPCIVVGCISTRNGLSYISRGSDDANIFEIRYDSLRKEGVDDDKIIEFLKKRKKPVLLTCRTKDEGGNYSWRSSERILCFQRLLPYVDAIDLELKNLKFMEPVLKEARGMDRQVFLSCHSLKRKVTYGRLKRWIEEFRHYRVSIYKISSLCRSKADLSVLVRVLLDYPELRLGLMAVGPMAAASRVVLPTLGSRLVYGYLDEPAAPGQPSAKDVKNSLFV